MDIQVTLSGVYQARLLMYANEPLLTRRYEKRRLWMLRRMQVSVTCDNNHHQMTYFLVFLFV